MKKLCLHHDFILVIGKVTLMLPFVVPHLAIYVGRQCHTRCAGSPD